MAKVGRPRKLKAKEVKDLLCAFEEYIDNTDVPIIAGFAYQARIDRTKLYDYPEFSTLIKRCIDKKESALENGILNGSIPPAAGIFSLKQLGWSDKQEIAHTGKDGGPIRLTRAEDLSDEELASIATTGRK